MLSKTSKIILIVVVVLIILTFYYQYYINVRPQKQLLVLRNYNPEAGLHWAGIYNTLVAYNEAKKRNLKLVVILDSGLYLERNKKFLEQYKDYIDHYNNEWFSYYFEPIGVDEPEINYLWKSGKLDDLPSLIMYNLRRNVIGYKFDRDALESSDTELDYAKLYSELIKLKPYLKEKVENFYNKYMKGKFVIGIHVRGTDKFSSVDSHENNPKHFTYQKYVSELEREILEQQKIQNKPVCVLAVSDEQPFIDYIKQNLGNKYQVIIADNIIRSNISTSGVNILCDDDNPECKHYKDNSIHRGMPDKSSFKKGLDAVFEVYLLSKCDVFYKSRGNFSNSVTYINPNQKVIDMVSAFG